MQLDLIVTCKRCGREQAAEYCWDCRLVAPKMCAGGLNARGMREKRRQEYADRVAFSAMLRRVAGFTTR